MSFERLLKPRSIAVFGGAHAHELVRQNDRMGYAGDIWPVHPRASEIHGRKVYRTVADLPGCPDAAYVGVNREATIAIVRALAERGAGGAVCYASGFAEAGPEGAALAANLLDAAGDMPLLGPNCYGLLNYVDGAMLWPDQQGGRRVAEGVAIVTMSSNVGFNLTMQRRGLPIAYLLSLGNRLKFDLEDAIRAMAREAGVTAIGLFLETIPDPGAFQQAVQAAREAGKPVVALKMGRSEQGRQMVVSHTASLAGRDRVVDALFERAGVARIGTLEAFVEALKALHVLGPLPGGRIAAMSTSGGDLIHLADAIGGELTLPALSERAAARVRATVHERVAAANPLDFQMFDWNDEARLYRTFRAFLSDDFDLALCVLDYPRADRCDPSSWGGAERAFARAVRETPIPGVVLASFADTIQEPAAERLMEEGVALLAGVDAGLAGVRAAVGIGAAWQRPPGEALLVSPGLPAPEATRVLDEAAAKDLLEKRGLKVPRRRVVANADEAVAAAAELGFPVVVKALGIAHKTEAGAVRLNLSSAAEVAAAVAAMAGLAQRFLVEEMVAGAVAELLVGVAREPTLGPYLVVGSGGDLVEVLRDSAAVLLPTSRSEVLRSIGRLRCAPLLQGYRGAPPADLDAAAGVVLEIAAMVHEDPRAIQELDINPLLLLPEGAGAVVADALVRLVEPDTH